MTDEPHPVATLPSTPEQVAAQPTTDPCLVLRPSEIEVFDRGSGVKTVPFVGKLEHAGQ